jgi:hypothetical protein
MSRPDALGLGLFVMHPPSALALALPRNILDILTATLSQLRS